MPQVTIAGGHRARALPPTIAFTFLQRFTGKDFPVELAVLVLAEESIAKSKQLELTDRLFGNLDRLINTFEIELS